MDRLFTLKRYAQEINGRQYRQEIDSDLRRRLKEDEVVVLYGASDDLLEIDGVFQEEVGAYDGGLFEPVVFGNTDYYDFVASEEKQSFLENNNYPYIDMVWSPENSDFSWIIDTNIPHERFIIYEDDDTYCEGVLFYLEDLRSMIIASR